MVVAVSYLCSRSHQGDTKMEVPINNATKKLPIKQLLKDVALNEGKPPNLTLTSMRLCEKPELIEDLCKFEESEVD